MADPVISAAYISGLFTIAAAAIAFGPVAFQLRKQGSLNRTALIETEKLKFKAQFYWDGVSAARAVSNASADFHGYLRSAQVEVEISSLARQEGFPASYPTKRFPEVIKLRQELSNSLLGLIFLIEERRGLDPRLLIFRDALNVASYALQTAFDREAQVSIMKAFPTEQTNGEIYPYTPPNDDELQVFKGKIDLITDALADMGSYAEDFIVELQNLLLGEIFGNSIEHRKPLDPSRKVISLSAHKELSAWIATTPWGLECSRIEKQTLAQIARETKR